MADMVGLINIHEPEEKALAELTGHRPLAAVPFGGRYRLIDFALSNMVNSGIRNVGILFKQKYRSLFDHLRSGKDWDLARKHGGLIMLPPSDHADDRGDLGNFFANLEFIRRSHEPYVAVSGTATVCNIDLREALAVHRAHNADLTIVYCEQPRPKDCPYTTYELTIDADGRVKDVTLATSSSGKRTNIPLNMFILTKDVLIDLVTTGSARGDYCFFHHGIIQKLPRLKAYAYRFLGHVAHISGIASYLDHNLALLDPAIWHELFFASGAIHTKSKDEPPTKYINGALVRNSLVASGCLIAGRVESSVLFRNVKIGAGAAVSRSVIMQRCVIEPGAVLENVICDKDVHITAGKLLKGEPCYPLVIKKGVTV